MSKRLQRHKENLADALIGVVLGLLALLVLGKLLHLAGIL